MLYFTWINFDGQKWPLSMLGSVMSKRIKHSFAARGIFSLSIMSRVGNDYWKLIELGSLKILENFKKFEKFFRNVWECEIVKMHIIDFI